MATCSITDTFIIDADTFYVALTKAQEDIVEKELSNTESLKSPVTVSLMKSDDIKVVFGSE